MNFLGLCFCENPIWETKEVYTVWTDIKVSSEPPADSQRYAIEVCKLCGGERHVTVPNYE